MALYKPRDEAAGDVKFWLTFSRRLLTLSHD
jgi:hypothetical protein